MNEAATWHRARTLDVLERCELLQGLAPADLESVARLVRLQTFAERTDIFAEGQPCTGAWIVVAGQVRLYHAATDGRQQVVGFRTAGAVLDLGAALDARPFTATGTTGDRAVLVHLPRATLLALLQRHPALVRNVIDLLCAELRQRDLATAVAGLKDARSRVNCAILRLAQQYGVAGGSGLRIDHRLTRRDIADVAGVTIETAIRAISDLQRQRIVRTDSQIIEILDVQRLCEATGCGECQLGCAFAAPAAVAVAPTARPGNPRAGLQRGRLSPRRALPVPVVSQSM